MDFCARKEKIMSDVKEIIQKINGTFDNKPKSSLTVSINYLDKNGNQLREGPNVSAFKPEIQINRLNKYCQIDLKFKTTLDNDLSAIWNLIESYKSVFENRKEEEYPLLSITIVPNDDACHYIAVANNPIFWTLGTDRPISGNAVISLCFEASDVIFYEADVNERQLQLEIERELRFSEE